MNFRSSLKADIRQSNFMEYLLRGLSVIPLKAVQD